MRATDSDGTAHTDPTPATRAFSVDTVPPDTVIDDGPSGTTTDTTPTFTFHGTEPGSLRCSLDDGSFVLCSSPRTLGPLADGPHTFAVRAVDGVGNQDPEPATRSFAVDTSPPDTVVTSGPAGPTRDATPTFGFTSTEAASTFECAIDTGDFVPCTSPYTVPTALANGTHTFAVRATDSTQNLDATPATRTFRVDTIPPNTVITAGPSGTITRRTVRFWFGAVDERAAGFECRIDLRAWRRCTSPREYQDLPLGAHVFRVRAFDAAGNRDPRPARREFRIVAG